MGGLFGGGGTTISTSDPLIGAIRIQTSVYGQPVPIVLGRTRVTANLIWYGDFQAIPHTTTTSSGGGGGKGGGGEVTSSNTTYTYQAAVAMNLCEGPVSAIGAIWAGKDQTDMAKLGMTLYSGSLSQSAWGYLTTKHPDEALAYPGSAYVAGGAYQLNSSAGLPNHSFEVSGPLAFSGSIPDANPKDIVSQYLGNAQWGSGFPAAMVGDLMPFSNYCVANSIFLSPAIIEQRQAHEYLTEWVRLCNSEVVWSEGKLKIVPYGDQAATGNGVTFTPNVTPIYDLADDDFLPTGGDPVTVLRKTVADAFNTVQVEFINRANQYNIEIAEAKDQSDIELRGLRPAEPLKAHAIADPAVARFVAQKEVQRYQQVRNEYEFKLGWKYCLLEPMDIVTLTDAGLGMYLFPVRIIEIEEDESGALTVRAEEFPSGVATASLYPVEIVGGYVLNNNVPPGAVNDPVIFEPPNVMTAPNLEVWIGASGGANWGGCEVWVSEDNASYRKIGNITNPARHGLLTGTLASGSDPDTTHTLAVDLTVSGGVLTSGTQADADNGNTLMWVDGELIAYQTATLTSAYHYNLTYLRRGQRGSNIGAHNTGAKFARLDGAIFRYVVPREMIGRPVWLKFASFNLFGNALQSLAECTAYNYTIAGNRPAGLTSLSAAGGMFLNQLGWTFAANQYDRDYTEIWGSTTNDRATALPLTSAKSPTASWKHPGLQPAQTWYYWGRVVDTSGNTSDFYPTNATAGVSAAPSADPSALLTQLQGALGEDQLAAELAAPIGMIPGQQVDLRRLNDAADQAAEAVLNATLKLAEVDSTMTDAGIVIDHDTGEVYIYGVREAERRLSSAEVRLNGAEASINLKASVTYVDQAIATAVIDPSQIAALDDIYLRLTTAEADINGAEASITLKASQTEVNGINGRLVTAEGEIDVLQGQIVLKAETATVNAIDARLNTAETTLNTIDGASIVQNVASLRRLSRDADAVAEAQLAGLLFADRNITALATVVASAKNELYAHTNDGLAAEAGARLTLAAQVDATAAALTSEQTTRATADSAQASSISTLQARLDTGDYATVKTTATATANALGDVEAKWGVQVQTMADGVRAAAGIELLAGTDGETVFAILANKLLIYKPDGTGVPKQIVTLGTVNGLTALGLDGNLIIDGSIVARSLAAESVTADKIVAGAITTSKIGAGQITADLIISASCTSFERKYISGTNGTWVASSFYMAHDGVVASLTNINFIYSTGGGTYSWEGRTAFDQTYSYDGFSGTFTNSSGPSSISIQSYTWLAAGWHTLYVYASHSGATGAHTVYSTLLKSFR